MVPPSVARPSLLVTTFVGVLVTTSGISPASAAGDRMPPPTRVSVSSTQLQANGASRGPSVSADGRYVVFSSTASHLVPADTNGSSDVFRRDRRTGTTRRVSVSSAGTQADRGSNTAGLAVSADGRYIVFTSGATNLVPGAAGQSAVYRRDIATGTTQRVSVATDGTPSREAYDGTISPDGRYIAFKSEDNIFVPGSAAVTNIFLRDVVAGTTAQVNVSSTGEQPNFAVGGGIAVSTGGRYVVFASPATNLVAGDRSDASDVFRRDMTTGRTMLVSRSSTGLQSNRSSEFPTMTPDGRYIAFISTATNFVPGPSGLQYEVFVRDLQTGTTSWVSTRRSGGAATSGSHLESLSADARYVAFTSASADLVPGDTNDSWDIFVRDRVTGTLRRASGTGTGTQADGDSGEAALSGDGTRIAFTSLADNLVAADTNEVADVFLRVLSR